MHREWNTPMSSRLVCGVRIVHCAHLRAGMHLSSGRVADRRVEGVILTDPNFQGNCTSPNKCTCEIGWSGADCSKCVCLPGCVNGGCEKAFECNCEVGWSGMLCDKRK